MASTAPRRRHSPAVYRRRRLMVLMILIVIAVAIWLLIAQPWRSWSAEPATGGTPTAAAEKPKDVTLPVPESSAVDGEADADADSDASAADEGETAEHTPLPVEESTAATPVADPCTNSALDVEAITEKESYASGENPNLSIRLTNSGSTDCTLNVGTAAQVFTITSGDDTWWRSTDCQKAPSDMVVVLAAGQTVTSAAPLTWDRTRSAVGTCDDPNRPRAPGGGSTFHLSVEIGGVSSTQTAQFMLW